MHVTTLAASETSLFGEPAAFEGGLTEVAPGTFAWLQPNGDLGESNAGLVVAIPNPDFPPPAEVLALAAVVLESIEELAPETLTEAARLSTASSD